MSSNKDSDRQYPDISELLRKKDARRRRLAKLSFEEKIEIVRRLQKLNSSIKSDSHRMRQDRRTRSES